MVHKSRHWKENAVENRYLPWRLRNSCFSMPPGKYSPNPWHGTRNDAEIVLSFSPHTESLRQPPKYHRKSAKRRIFHSVKMFRIALIELLLRIRGIESIRCPFDCCIRSNIRRQSETWEKLVIFCATNGVARQSTYDARNSNVASGRQWQQVCQNCCVQRLL